MSNLTKKRMDINRAMSICFRNSIRCYPISFSKGSFWRIKVEIQGKPKVFEKKLLNKREINDAVTKTYFYYAKKCLDIEKEVSNRKMELPAKDQGRENSKQST